jgi:hypothetical protein
MENRCIDCKESYFKIISDTVKITTTKIEPYDTVLYCEFYDVPCNEIERCTRYD